MLKIAICDDEKVICETVKKTMAALDEREQLNIETTIFESGEKLCDHLKGGASFDLIFLDIELGSMSGVEIGKVIREEQKDNLTQIVYISAKQGYAMDLFQNRPLDFLVKPLDEKKIEKAIRKTMELCGIAEEVFSFKVGTIVRKIPMKDILYFESRIRKLHMVTVDGEIEFYGSITTILEKLEKYHFIQIHNSIVVNYRHVMAYHYKELTMINHEKLAISQSRRKYIREIQLHREWETL